MAVEGFVECTNCGRYLDTHDEPHDCKSPAAIDEERKRALDEAAAAEAAKLSTTETRPMSAEKKVSGEKRLPHIGNFGWIVRYEHSDSSLDFKAYEIVSVELSPQKGRERFAKANSVGGETESLDDAEVTISGYVKWDGCSEMVIGQPHFCGADDVKRLADALVELHKLALLIPGIDYECAGYTKPEEPEEKLRGT